VRLNLKELLTWACEEEDPLKSDAIYKLAIEFDKIDKFRNPWKYDGRYNCDLVEVQNIIHNMIFKNNDIKDKDFGKFKENILYPDLLENLLMKDYFERQAIKYPLIIVNDEVNLKLSEIAHKIDEFRKEYFIYEN